MTRRARSIRRARPGRIALALAAALILAPVLHAILTLTGALP